MTSIKNNLILVATFALFSDYLQAESWLNLLNAHQANISLDTYELLKKQYETFAQGQSLKIADPAIKQIPIVENHEVTINLAYANHARISIMTDEQCLLAHDFPGDVDPRAPSYSKMRLSVFEKLQHMIEILDILAPEFGYQPGMLEIKLFEGLRDIATQKHLFDEKKASILSQNPEMTEQQAYDETCKWVSPYINNVPAHSTGAAIDIALYDRKSQTFCNMGRFNTSGKQAPTFCPEENLTAQQKYNRLLMLLAATQAGLTNYAFEFWHYSFGDRYAVYHRESNEQTRQANYGSV